MSVALAVALLALLVALFAVVALVAVYARVRALEAGRSVELSGYASLVGRPAPRAVAPRVGESLAVVAVLDSSCASCHVVWDTLVEVSAQVEEPVRYVGLVDRAGDLVGFREGGRAELLADVSARADLFEGYSPTLLAVGADGTVVHRSFVYPDTDLRALLPELIEGGRA